MPAGYLLDTNVVSEAHKRHADPGVIAFFEEARTVGARVFISVLTLGELRRGVAARRSRDAAGAQELAAWVDATEAEYSDRVIPVDRSIARLWGELSAGRSPPAIDTLIAATALVHGLTLVTRNVRDFAETGVDIVNPWQPT